VSRGIGTSSNLIPNPAELRRRGIEVLVKELGYADAMRFLQQFGPERGDYTSERDRLAILRTDEELLAETNRLAEQERNRPR
jgi:hypothetical protein